MRALLGDASSLPDWGPACQCILGWKMGACLPGKTLSRGEGRNGACLRPTPPSPRGCYPTMCFSAPRRTSKGMRIRPEGTGPANWTSSCPWWGMQWGWAMSGGFPTWPSRTGEVRLFRSFRLRRGGAGTCGLGRCAEPWEGAGRGGSPQPPHAPAPSGVGISAEPEGRRHCNWLALDAGGFYQETRERWASLIPH